MLVASNLRFEAQGRLLFKLEALSLGAGVTLIQGDEGTGKTTLLRAIAGEISLPGSQWQRAADTQVFWADPHSLAYAQITANAYFAIQQAHYPRWSAALQYALAEALGLASHAEKPLYMLSTGSKRKVWLCAAAASGASVTLLDEPFAALDARSIGTVVEVLTDAATQSTRAWVVADYQAPRGVPLAQTIVLGG
jgi:ABC-type nitrate/sulfonate/bicarbonate transport system ATPase subunit